MRDIFYIGITRPGTIFLRTTQWSAHRMQTFYISFLLQVRKDIAAHTRHDTHVHYRIFRVGKLNAVSGIGRTNRTHTERDYIQGSSLHASS